MSDASIGWDTILELSSDNGATWDEVAEVTNLDPPGDELDTPQVTHMRSPNATHEYTIGLNEPGDMALEMNFAPGSDTDGLFQAIKAAREVIKARITWPNKQRWTFDGILKAYKPNGIGPGDVMKASGGVKVTGSYGIDVAP